MYIKKLTVRKRKKQAGCNFAFLSHRIIKNKKNVVAIQAASI